MRLPDPPVNVRVVTPLGSIVAIDTVYEGTDEEGIAQWRALVPEDFEFTEVKVDTLPAKTAIIFPRMEGDLDVEV